MRVPSLRRLFQQKNMGRRWGSVKLGVGQVGLYLTALNLAMISLTLWQTGWIQQNFWPLAFWQFALILVSIILALMLFAWRIDMPSFFAAWNDQFYRHRNPLRDDIQEILRRQGVVEKHLGISSGKAESEMATFIKEVDPDECLYCLHGEIPDDADIPLPLCIKHIDIARFILDKAGIRTEIEYRGEN